MFFIFFYFSWFPLIIQSLFNICFSTVDSSPYMCYHFNPVPFFLCISLHWIYSLLMCIFISLSPLPFSSFPITDFGLVNVFHFTCLVSLTSPCISGISLHSAIASSLHLGTLTCDRFSAFSRSSLEGTFQRWLIITLSLAPVRCESQF